MAVVSLAFAHGYTSAERCNVHGRFPRIDVLGTFASVGLSVVALFLPGLVERLAGFVLLAWVVLAEQTDQFIWVNSQCGVLNAAAWLLLPIAGGAVLPSAGYWCSGLACWAASFSGVTATVFSMHCYFSAAGLLKTLRFD